VRPCEIMRVSHSPEASSHTFRLVKEYKCRLIIDVRECISPSYSFEPIYTP
jgi:hypothetical protein